MNLFTTETIIRQTREQMALNLHLDPKRRRMMRDRLVSAARRRLSETQPGRIHEEISYLITTLDSTK
jgi:hypothetical protein